MSQTVNDSRVLLGGGWPEMVMAKAVDELARKTPGKKSHAIEAFSRALLAIPTIIADNAGLDSAELISQLRAEHHKEESNAGVDVISGSVSNMPRLLQTGLCSLLVHRKFHDCKQFMSAKCLRNEFPLALCFE